MSDANNFTRVLIFNNGGQGIDSLAANDPSADGVIGQNNFNTNSFGTSANTLSNPMGVCTDNCQLYVADLGNDRVLIYDSIPTGTTNPPADNVLGQPNLTTRLPYAVSANSIQPIGVQSVNGVVYVSDHNSNRVLEFSCASLSSNSVSASLVRGGGPTVTFTPTSTPTATPTATVTPTPTVNSNVLVQSVVAAPNMVHGNQPVQIQFTLGRSAKVELSLYTLTGEKMYQVNVQGNAGVNSLVWKVQNGAHQSVASGLYIYVLDVDDGQNHQRTTGKIAVIR